MLTRLKVSGFKNLVDVDVRFGAFTCIAGRNAVGKSNLFDAIRFLSYLASDTLMNAALSIRSESGKTGEIRNLFHRAGNQYTNRMCFEAEMILPNEGVDDLGQKAEASITLVRYVVELGYHEHETHSTLGALELIREQLEHINVGSAKQQLQFPHSARWRRSVIEGRRTTPFITTSGEGENRIVRLSQDGKQGRPKSISAAQLPRTVLSTTNSAESPTALLVRRELQSWRLLQLEPAALREPDRFTTSPGVEPNGAHLAATLYHLARTASRQASNGNLASSSHVYDAVAERLSHLIDAVVEVGVDREEQRELLTLQIRSRDGTVHPARSLSDGTLRFLALAVLDLDPNAGGLICMEEPENGIHPERIPAILTLLQDIACDVDEPVGPDNPLRQVIINTHSPSVVTQVPDDSLLVATLGQTIIRDERSMAARFGWLPDTWRAQAEPGVAPISKGELLSYLNPTLPSPAEEDGPSSKSYKPHRRVIDRPDFRQLMLFPSE